jgi:hypothetical protein
MVFYCLIAAAGDHIISVPYIFFFIVTRLAVDRPSSERQRGQAQQPRAKTFEVPRSTFDLQLDHTPACFSIRWSRGGEVSREIYWGDV